MIACSRCGDTAGPFLPGPDGRPVCETCDEGGLQ